jgi:hypothetical protein
MEAERLYALIDGLAVRCVIRPDRATPSLMRKVSTRHLSELPGSPRRH